MPLAASRNGPRIFYLQAVEQPEANVIQLEIGAVRQRGRLVTIEECGHLWVVGRLLVQSAVGCLGHHSCVSPEHGM